MAQPAQGSGGFWAASRPVGGQEKIPITSQKQLRGKMVNLITASSIKKFQLCIVNNKKREEEGKNKREERKHRKKQKAERKIERISKETKKNKRLRSEERKQKCDKAYTNRLLPFLPLNSLPFSQPIDLRISYLGPFFQSGQFFQQDYPKRLPTLEIGSFFGLKSTKKLSIADQSPSFLLSRFLSISIALFIIAKLFLPYSYYHIFFLLQRCFNVIFGWQ